MELRTFIIILWRRRWVFLLTAGLGVALSIIAAVNMTPMYQATSTLRIWQSRAGHEDLAYTERLMQTYSTIITSYSARTELQRRLGIAEEAIPSVDVELPANTELIYIEVSDEDPMHAANVANTLAEIMTEQNQNVARGDRLYTVDIIGAAVPPEHPDTPGKKMVVILGLLVGLGGGMVFAFLWENLDSALYTRAQIEQVAGLTTLAEIPTVKDQKQIRFLNGHSVEGEAFRQLRTRLFVLRKDAPLRTLLVTSAEPGEGKSTIVCNLALAIAHAGRSVVVVDGDLRRPVLHTIFGVANEKGLSSVLKHEATLDEALQASSTAGIQVLPSGPLPANPSELLDSACMQQLMEQLIERFDMVLLDSPALIAVADGAVLTSLVDGVLLVVGLAQARQEAVQEMRQRLIGLRARPVGLVVNRAEPHTIYAYYQHKR